MDHKTTIEKNAMNSPQTFNKLFFGMAIVALIIGFIRFGKVEMIDLSSELFALFYLLLRINKFLYDKNFIASADTTNPRFQTALFFEMMSWSLWILSGYFLNDYITRISFPLLALSIAVSTFSLIAFPVYTTKIKAKNYRIIMNLVYFLVIMSVFSGRDGLQTFLEWKILIALNVLVMIDFIAGKRMASN